VLVTCVGRVKTLETYHVHVVTRGLFLRLARPHPVLHGPLSKQYAPNPQSVSATTVTGQNPQIPFNVSTRQLKPFGAIQGFDGSPLRKPQVEEPEPASRRWSRSVVGKGGAGVTSARAYMSLVEAMKLTTSEKRIDRYIEPY
jgi:hypothetical protein